jgi:uncharacterized protein (TIGR03437 family)
MLPALTEGTVVYLVDTSNSGGTIATARASVSPHRCNEPSIRPLGIVNAASFSAVAVAPEGFATITGARLSVDTAEAGPPYPSRLAGVEALLSGSRCPLQYVSPGQINFVVPAGITPGRHLLTVGQASAEVNVAPVSPGIFTLNGRGTGTPIATTVEVRGGAATAEAPVYDCSASGCSARAIQLTGDLAEIYFTVYATGIRRARALMASLGTHQLEVLYAGAQPLYPGLDQVNLKLTRFEGLVGRKTLHLRADGLESNFVELQFE